MQLVQLQQAKAELSQLGYGVAAISYDSQELLDEFAVRKGIDYPLLSDPDSHWLTQAGLKNLEASGPAEGVALPATLVVNPQGELDQVFMESAYQDRLTPGTLVGLLGGRQHVEARPAAHADRPEFEIRQSEEEVTAGSVFSVEVTVLLPEGHHLYGPDAVDVIPLALKFPEHPLLEVVSLEYPIAPTLDLLGEKVPAYETSLTVKARLKVRSSKELRAQLPDLSLWPLKATLSYQICTDSLCLAPDRRELEWTFQYRSLDLQRSPDHLQRQ